MGHPQPSTPAERVQAVSYLLAHMGEYGVVTRLSQSLGVSRQTLYTWRQLGQQALTQACTPAPAPLGVTPTLERQILTLLVEGHASYRGLQTCLHTLTGHWVSLDTLTAVVATAQTRALRWMETQVPATVRALALDEIYGTNRHGAYLHAVDLHSGAVWAAVGPVAVDADSWTLVLWDLHARGLRWRLVATDGGAAMQDAIATVTPRLPRQRDLWHVLHRASQAQGRLDRRAVALDAQTATVERQAARVAAGHKPRGQRPKTDVAAHLQELATARQVAADLRYLLGELRRLLEVVVLDHRGVLDQAQRQTDLEALLGLLGDVVQTAPSPQRAELVQWQTHLQHALPDLLTFVAPVEQVQQALRTVLPPERQALLGWAWQRRRVLRWSRAQIVASVPADWRDAARVLLAAWDEAVRGSSAVEGWHSVLRPHLAVHRTLSPGMLAVLAVWHNHRVAPRGLHNGQSPLQRSGMDEAPRDWLVALGYPPAADAASSVLPLARSERLAAAA